MSTVSGSGPFNTATPRTTPASLSLVNGRTFTVASEDGSILRVGDGTVFQDIRILDNFDYAVADGAGRTIGREHLTTVRATPFHAVSVARRLPDDTDGREEPAELYIHRQWVGRGTRHVIEIENAGLEPLDRQLSIRIGTDFAHLFDVKAGLPPGPAARVYVGADGQVHLTPAGSEQTVRVRIDMDPRPDHIGDGIVQWHLICPPRSGISVTLVAEPEVEGSPVGVFFPIGGEPPHFLAAPEPADSLAVTSADRRWSIAIERALSDLRSLRIFDPDDPSRVIVAAGAPWFMTLFGRDSVLTSWMALPFEPDLAVGTLRELADLQGTETDDLTEEEPGRILHELRRRGGAEGAFATRARYYGTVDATPLFVMLAAETARWGHLPDDLLRVLWPAVAAATDWVRRSLADDPRGFLAYQRRSEKGLANQGWKDSWDGVSYADGRLPTGPIALVEVQGYAYAALLGAAELAGRVDGSSLDPSQLEREAADLRERFNEAFWDEESSSYALGLAGDGSRIDAVTTNPGHAIWTGITDPDFAQLYVDRHVAGDLWTGWGLRTMSPSAARYNPVSYHNGSVWPHDTALVVAGAARLGRYDLVDRLVDGALEAAAHFDGRPPELFAGLDRAEVPAPVPYPSSCSPQAWASASILSLASSTTGLGPPVAPASGPTLARTDGRSPIVALGPVRVARQRHPLIIPGR